MPINILHRTKFAVPEHRLRPRPANAHTPKRCVQFGKLNFLDN